MHHFSRCAAGSPVVIKVRIAFTVTAAPAISSACRVDQRRRIGRSTVFAEFTHNFTGADRNLAAR
jgi:hypothetical protein